MGALAWRNAEPGNRREFREAAKKWYRIIAIVKTMKPAVADRIQKLTYEMRFCHELAHVYPGEKDQHCETNAAKRTEINLLLAHVIAGHEDPLAGTDITLDIARAWLSKFEKAGRRD